MLLVAAKEHRRAAMRAEGADEADFAVGVAERDQIFTEQPNAHWRAICLREFSGQCGGYPITPQRLSHRRAGSYPCQTFIIRLAEQL
jgi:hypothetical protein